MNDCAGEDQEQFNRSIIRLKKEQTKVRKRQWGKKRKRKKEDLERRCRKEE
jgi:hypothetical protein